MKKICPLMSDKYTTVPCEKQNCSWWNDIQELKGWKVQQNMVTHHVRIIDPNKMRRAWGTQKAMEDLFERIAKANHIK